METFPKVMAKELRQGNRKIGQARVAQKSSRKFRAASADFKVYKGSGGKGRARKGGGVAVTTIPRPARCVRSIGVTQ